MVDDLKGMLTVLLSFKQFNLLTFLYSSLYLCAFLVFLLVIVHNKSTEVLSTCYSDVGSGSIFPIGFFFKVCVKELQGMNQTN